MTVICPHCNSDLKVPNRAWFNAEQYSKSVNVTTECCFNIVEITQQRSYTVKASSCDVDDWSVPVGDLGREAYAKLDAYAELDGVSKRPKR